MGAAKYGGEVLPRLTPPVFIIDMDHRPGEGLKPGTSPSVMYFDKNSDEGAVRPLGRDDNRVAADGHFSPSLVFL